MAGELKSSTDKKIAGEMKSSTDKKWREN